MKIRSTIVPILWLWLACTIIGAALAGSVKADPGDDFAADHAADICIAIDERPDMDGLIRVLNAVTRTGLSPRDAGTAVADSVIYVCPHHLGLLRAFADRYAPKKGQLT